VIDSEGYRFNVGIILSNANAQVLWARRIGQTAWQFPQGGIKEGETPQQALFRELGEEVGLYAEHVDILGSTQGWLKYRLPKSLMRNDEKPMCIGQKQVWYLLRFLGDESDVNLAYGKRPEFDDWRWVDYWHPIKEIIGFKKAVYQQALSELAPLL